MRYIIAIIFIYAAAHAMFWHALKQAIEVPPVIILPEQEEQPVRAYDDLVWNND